MRITWRSDRFPIHEHRCPTCSYVVRCLVKDCESVTCPRCYIAVEGLDSLIRLDAWLRIDPMFHKETDVKPTQTESFGTLLARVHCECCDCRNRAVGADDNCIALQKAIVKAHAASLADEEASAYRAGYADAKNS